MPIQTPTFLPAVWAANGQTADIPLAQAETGRASYQLGFPPETSLPRESGGVPPHRLDMNGILAQVTGHTVYQQSGSIYPWSASLDYLVHAHVLGADGIEYVCVQVNGVSSTVQDPTTDTLRNYWRPYKFSLVDLIYPVGIIIELATSVDPNSIWAGTSWQRLAAGRMTIAAGGAYPLGSTGGNAQITLSVNQLPAHNHNGSTSTQGNHAHTRGSMNITGRVARMDDLMADAAPSGAFWHEAAHGMDWSSGPDWYPSWFCNFDASRSWTGETSWNGQHSHSVSTNNTGGGQAVNVLPPYLAVNKWQRIA